MPAERTRFAVDGAGEVSGLWLLAAAARACFVLAHGAGAGMTHPFLEKFSNALAERQIATLRFQFPYMEKRSRRPDPPAMAEAAVRAAVAEAGRRYPHLPLIAGGKSFGGRMTSQAQAKAPLSGVRGIAFLGFPLHPAGKPSVGRAEHLSQIEIPLLFMQGTHDQLADLALLRPVCARLPAATLHVVDQADHSFHVPKRSGRDDDAVRGELVETFVSWVGPLSS